MAPSPSWPRRATLAQRPGAPRRSRWCSARGAAHYEPIELGRRVRAASRASSARLASPDEAIFYTSGRTSNEAAFLYQLFVRGLRDQQPARLLEHVPRVERHRAEGVIGVGKGTVQLEDFELADAIFVVGQNPGTNHPRMLTTLEAAAKRGAMIVSVNPLAEVGTMRFSHPQSPLGLLGDATTLARMHVPVRINGDVAFFQGVMKAMLEEEARAPGRVVDRDFVEEHTRGLRRAAARPPRARLGRSWPLSSGVSAEQMRDGGAGRDASRARPS